MNPVRIQGQNFTFIIAHFTLIFHFAFIKQVADLGLKCQMAIDNSLPGLRSRTYFGGVGKIDNCKLIIASEGGLG